MIISRTPLRISLGGGGTDLPSYYEKNDYGFLIAAAITKYVYIAVHRNFDDDILLKYSETEKVQSVNDVKHPLLRETMRISGCDNSVEISSMADIPAGTGLGSSGAFAVGALNALNMYQHRNSERAVLAAEACRIEIEVLKEPVGKQDQYIAAYGGINGFTFRSDGSVLVENLNLEPSIRTGLEENLLLFYTGVRRSASKILATEQENIQRSSGAIKNNLTNTRDIGYQTREVLLNGNLKHFGELLTEQWNLKFVRQPSVEHDQINQWIEDGISAGAFGGKLVGAGGGGFLLFYAPNKSKLRSAMTELGLLEVPFAIDYEGSTIIVSR
jgi:D-glycero-alpha-D-manno-heptose-7-phosphate kinase